MAPEKLPIWYTGQLLYYMPLRYLSYQRRGYHYFIADLCYWVNLMVVRILHVANLARSIPMGFPIIILPLDSHVLSCARPGGMGHYRLAQLPRIPFIVSSQL